MIHPSERRRGERHGMTPRGYRNHHPLYKIWEAMLRRCRNEHDTSYANYGGRGVTVCARWTASFTAFLADMGERPSPRHTLDRIDTNGHYEPSNCRWATQREQMRNVRYNQRVTWRGETHCIVEWAEITGISDKALYSRVARGWDPERALTTPARAMRKRGSLHRVLTVGGVARTVREWAAITGLKPKTILARIYSGHDEAAAVTAPLDPRRARSSRA